ncbi:FAD binding domain protein [Podospora australis]|uniref:FAD binding domain protein n=1 Tax=Podospora australis TaxID=1536484 RepID=A0AAN7AGW9_9PEZI|nr:FAD binding domain protein [Podospora australis]
MAMLSPSFSSFGLAATLFILAAIPMMMFRRKQAVTSTGNHPAATAKSTSSQPLASSAPEQLPQHIQRLIAELTPGSVILQSDPVAFQQAVDANYWAQQNREITPACIVRPHDAQQLSRAVKILKQEYDSRRAFNQDSLGKGKPERLFAVRSGGLNPALGAATVKGGVVIDLGLICDVNPSEDGSTVTIGAGAKWIDVYKNLEEKGLVVMGGRSTPAGVGGLTLQGGLSFYTPRHGFVCSNAERYEVVLADGNIVTASASEHPDLWRVLKGGGNNFGIVTRITLRSFPLEPLWFGQVFAPAAFQQTKAMKAYHDYLEHASSGKPGAFDENAAGPILVFAHVRGVPFHIMVLQLVYTKVTPKNNKQWPEHWKKTGFTSLWSVRRDCSVRSHVSAVEQNGSTAPPGTRHMLAATTIRNDVETMQAVYAVFCRTTETMRHVKGLLFPMMFQAILPGWVNKGHPNVLGLQDCTEPLIIIGCPVTWADPKDDEFVWATIRRMLEEIDKTAAAKGTSHPYRFMNYCMDFQRPYDGCGEENRKLLREASQKYDPDGLFQKGCTGGFKLPWTRRSPQ